MRKGKIFITGTLISIFFVLSITGFQKKTNDNTLPKKQEQAAEFSTAPISEPESQNSESDVIKQPVITEMNWEGYFSGMEGCAVFYNVNENEYMVYNQELCNTQRSPCSTFKIISSLIGLENEIINPQSSVRPWSQEIFWNTEWNRDIGFEDAFRTSCVWYYRQVIDDIGETLMQEELNKLQYGNCDISNWQGTWNTNNDNPALTGFWIESSLLISPMEQVACLERIFGENSIYSDETILKLRQVMKTPENENVYGKTGLGKAYGEVVDAWFVGFTYDGNEPVYFCIYLGESYGKDVSSLKAKEIALQIISDIF